MDVLTLKLLMKKDTWLKYRNFIVPTALSSTGNYLLDTIDKYYSTFTTKDEVDVGRWATWLLFSAPHSMHTELRAVIEKIKETDVNEDDETTVFSGLVRRDYANKIAKEALRVVDGDTHDLKDVETLVEEFSVVSNKVNAIDSYFVNETFDELYAPRVGGLSWRLPWLNDAIGPIMRGDLLAVGAYVGVGKTTFLCSETSYMAQQLAGQKVLWVNLEEQGAKVKRRFVQSCLGWDNKKCYADPKATMKAYLDMFGGEDPLKLLDKSTCSVRDIELALKRDDYGLIIIDMVSKLQGFNGRGDEVTRQGLLYGWAREVAKDYAPVITVAQLTGDSEGVEYPSMAHLYGSRVAAQAELDVLLMIGTSKDLARMEERYLGVVKNKMPDVLPAFKLGRSTAKLNADIARYEEY